MSKQDRHKHTYTQRRDFVRDRSIKIQHPPPNKITPKQASNHPATGIRRCPASLPHSAPTHRTPTSIFYPACPQWIFLLPVQSINPVYQQSPLAPFVDQFHKRIVFIVVIVIVHQRQFLPTGWRWLFRCPGIPPRSG